MKGIGGGTSQGRNTKAREQSFLSFKKGNTVTNMSVSKDPKTGKPKIAVVMYYDEEPLPFPEF